MNFFSTQHQQYYQQQQQGLSLRLSRKRKRRQGSDEDISNDECESTTRTTKIAAATVVTSDVRRPMDEQGQGGMLARIFFLSTMVRRKH